MFQRSPPVSPDVLQMLHPKSSECWYDFPLGVLDVVDGFVKAGFQVTHMAVPFLVLNPIFTMRKSIARDSVTVIGRSFQSFDEWGIVRILLLR